LETGSRDGSKHIQEHIGKTPLIDSYFPEAAASRLSQHESFNKHLYRPNSYLHKWWARRSGTVFRFILKQLVDSPELSNFYSSGGLEGKKLLDPMMGGGTTIHEAIRLGANVAGIDIDPIPVMLTKTSLESRSPSETDKIFMQLLARMRSDLEGLFATPCPTCGTTTETKFVLYGLLKKCKCSQVVVVDSLTLRKEKNKTILLCAVCKEIYSSGTNHIHSKQSDIELITKDIKTCQRCHGQYRHLSELPFNERYRPLVVVGHCERDGQFYKVPGTQDLDNIKSARRRALNLSFAGDFSIKEGPKSDDLLRLGIKSYLELFTPRQLLYLDSAITHISEMGTNRDLFGLLISTSLEFNSLLCGYKGSDIRRPGAIRHVFSLHAYSIPATSVENNPIQSGASSGSLTQLYRSRVVRAAEWASNPSEISIDGEAGRVKIANEIDTGRAVNNWTELEKGTHRFLLRQADAAKVELPRHFFDYVVTDPPYYDNVQYSDLSAFFRVWLALLLPGEANWLYDRSYSAVNTGSNHEDGKYRSLMSAIWKNCVDSMTENGRLVFTFHHWKPEAWSELALSLKDARLRLVNRYVVHSENPSSVHIKNLKSLKHDAILVLSANPNVQTKDWVRPDELDTSESDRFVRDCGSLLGWTLASNLSDSDVREVWKEAIRA